MMAVHPSGYYAWLETPHCPRAIDDKRLLGHIKQSWLESGSVYGYRKVRDDLLALGETCGKHRVYRLMRQEKLSSQTGYHRRPSPTALENQYAEYSRLHWIAGKKCPPY
jgi:putative transposase